MKKVIQGLLVAMLSASTAHAAITSNHTYLTPRSSYNMASDWSMSGVTSNNPNMVGGDVAATAFWRQSHNSKEIAQYFGAGYAGDTVKVQDGSIQVQHDTDGASQALYSYDVDHSPSRTYTSGSSDKTGMGGRLTFTPEVRQVGVNLTYNQNLDFFLDGLTFGASAALYNANNDTHVAVVGGKGNTGHTDDGGVGKGLLDYFTGGDLGKTANGAQRALTHAKFALKAHNEVGVGDINVNFGYTLVSDEDSQVSLNLSAVVPTGSKVRSDFVFYPVVGNGGHWAIGGGLNSNFNVYRSEDNRQALDFSLAANYKYTLAATESRVLGLWNIENKRIRSGGHYRILAKKALAEVVPGANELAHDVKVTQGSSVEGLAGFSYRSGDFCIDAGYNLFWREAETVKLADASAWKNDTYAFIANNKQPSAKGVIGKSDYTKYGPIQAQGVTTTSATGVDQDVKDYVTTAAAASPKSLTHSVVGGAGYTFQGSRPVRVGLGGSYEFSNNKNDSIDMWSIWAKCGISF